MINLTLYKHEMKNSLKLMLIFLAVITLYVTIIISMYDPEMMEMLDTFGGKATYEWQEEKLYIKFDADLLELETVVKYAFGTLKAVDMQISEINIEDVVKDFSRRFARFNFMIHLSSLYCT